MNYDIFPYFEGSDKLKAARDARDARDAKIANIASYCIGVPILISSDFGPGWYTNHGIKELLFDKTIIAILLNCGFRSDIIKYLKENYPRVEYVTLDIVWLKKGTEFIINEYDGQESVRIRDTTNWITA